MNSETGTIYMQPPPKLENSIYEIRLEMWRRGGTFVQDLSRCFGSADLENQSKLIAAFPEIIERYDAFATVTKRQQQELIQREQEGDDE
ncbi:MAG: hypothetical protein ACK528_05855 [Alphaproteobacteria bacterium]|jgi:hypothetical protein